MKRILVFFVFAVAGCHPSLGERCNPLLFSDECTAGDPALSCVYPAHCGVAYCCPMRLESTTLPDSCHACPTDAGMAIDMTGGD